MAPSRLPLDFLAFGTDLAWHESCMLRRSYRSKRESGDSMNINKLFPYLSIKAKLRIAFVGLAAVPLAVLGGYGIRSLTQALTERALIQVRSDVVSKAATIEHFLTDVQRDVLYLAKSTAVQDFAALVGNSSSPRDYDSATRRLSEQFLYFSQGRRAYYQVRYLDEKGRERVRLNYDSERPVLVPEERLQDKSDRYYFQEAIRLQAGEIYVSPMDLNVEFGSIETPAQPVVRYATSVQDQQGRTKGVLIINIFATHLFALMSDGKPNGHSFLLNSDGDYLYSTERSDWNRFLDTGREHISQHYVSGIVSRLLSPESGTILESRGGVLAHAPVRLLNPGPERFWILATSIPRDTVLGPIERMRVLFLVMLSAVILIAAAVSAFAADQFQRPVLALRDGATVISKGNFDHRIRIETNDEIEDLGNQFNLMAEQLGEAARKMERWNEELHEEVVQRTQELRDSQERLRIENRKLDDIITAIGAELCLVDRSLKVVWANKICFQYHGGPDRVLGQSCYQACRDRGAPCEPCLALETFQDSKIRQLVREVRQGDQEQFYQTVSTPVVDESGKVIQVLELRLDITDSVRQERAARKQAAENEKLEALVQLSAGVIHEVANPLTAIRTTIDVMEQEPPADRWQYLDVVRKNIDRLSTFLHTFSLYAKPKKPELYPLDIGSVLQPVVELLHDEATKRRVLIVERHDADLPEVLGNSPQLQQVFLNLILNALDAMPKGGQIILSAQNQPSGTLTVAVEDTGVGIPSGQLEHVFEPFFSTKPSGTGLGLAIVLQILKGHEAELTVDSRQGSGTKFTVHFKPIRPLATAVWGPIK